MAEKETRRKKCGQQDSTSSVRKMEEAARDSWMETIA